MRLEIYLFFYKLEKAKETTDLFLPEPTCNVGHFARRRDGIKSLIRRWFVERAFCLVVSAQLDVVKQMNVEIFWQF